MSLALLMAIALELALASKHIEAASGITWLFLQLGVCVLCWMLMQWLPFARRHPEIVAVPLYCLLPAVGAHYLSALGGFDGPFFYAVYALAPVVAFLPCALIPRIIISTVMTGSFIIAYLVPHPEYLHYPLIHIPAFYIVIGSAVSILLGHLGYKLTREYYVLNELLSSDNRVLVQRADLSAQKVSELAQLLEVSKTTERTNIARYLHDELGQLIVGARMNITNLEHNFNTRKIDASSEELLVDLENLSGIIEGLNYSSRVIFDELRDGKIPSLELRIQALIDALPSRSAIEVRLSCETLSAPLSHEINEAIYRITQEALTNIMKHAGECRVAISIAEQRVPGREIVVRIHDEGIGFDVAAVRTGTWGLMGLSERVDTLSGHLTIESTSEGTTICACIPVKDSENDS
ncbi:MAG: hypothetical protein JKY56_08905 [Kofleriaceae bacterium]|nr:hypothetical protein [Kofleriaceae bacterium]